MIGYERGKVGKELSQCTVAQTLWISPSTKFVISLKDLENPAPKEQGRKPTLNAHVRRLLGTQAGFTLWKSWTLCPPS